MMKADDPFERAVAREEQLRKRGAAFDSPSGFVSLALKWFAALGLGWALVLAVHWWLFAEPRWLAVTHTVAFVLLAGYWTITVSFITVVRRRRPDLFRED